jgi:hypothetical protein
MIQHNVPRQSETTQGNGLFLIASKEDIQLTLEKLPRDCAYNLGMHIFLDSRFCVGSLYANSTRIEYRQNMPTIVGTGLQKLALKILTNLHTFQQKPITIATLGKLNNLDACVGTLRSWNLDCNLSVKRRTNQAQSRVKMNHKFHTNKRIKHTPRNINKNTQKLSVVKNEHGHRITIPDMSLFAGFFYDNRHFISRAMSCLPTWMRDLPNARGICLNAAVLLSAQTPGYYDGMTMQRVSMPNYTQSALQKSFHAEKQPVMTIKLPNNQKMEVMGVCIDNRADYINTIQGTHLLLGYNKTFVLLGNGINSEDMPLYTYVPGNIANTTLNASNALTCSHNFQAQDVKKVKQVKQVQQDTQNMIYKMRFLQAAMWKHEILHMQSNRLLNSLAVELKGMEQKIDRENMALLRMLQHSFCCGIHALACMHYF